MSTWPLWAAGLNAKEVDLRVRVVPLAECIVVSRGSQ